MIFLYGQFNQFSTVVFFFSTLSAILLRLLVRGLLRLIISFFCSAQNTADISERLSYMDYSVEHISIMRCILKG